MSTGGIIGTVVGGAIGLVIGGPIGMLIGAGIGMAGGMVIDPIEPDVAKPDPMQLTAPSAQEGIAVADVLGTTQLSGNFMWYCCPYSKAIKEKVGGGGCRGSKKITTGYEYYLSFAIGLCRGPVDTLHCIWEGDKVLWNGPISLGEATNGHVALSVEDRGTIDFYFGTDDQPFNSFMKKKTGVELYYPGLCYAVFRGFMIGNVNRVNMFQFIIQKTPSYGFNVDNYIGDWNYNPAHAIYHILVNGVGLPPDMIDDQSFSDAADTLAAEGLGISIPMKLEKPPIRYIESICQHIRACLYTNAAGDIAIRLFRKDTGAEDMVVISEEDLLEEVGVERQSLVETDNEVQVRATVIE